MNTLTWKCRQKTLLVICNHHSLSSQAHSRALLRKIQYLIMQTTDWIFLKPDRAQVSQGKKHPWHHLLKEHRTRSILLFSKIGLACLQQPIVLTVEEVKSDPKLCYIAVWVRHWITPIFHHLSTLWIHRLMLLNLATLKE